MITKQFRPITHTALAVAMLLGTSQNALSHTRLEIPVGTEGIRITNHIVIGHGCGEKDVIANSVVFPDGIDSTIKVNDAVSTDTIDAHLSNWGNLNQKVWEPGAFLTMNEKTDTAGSVVGFWSINGKIPNNMAAYVKFRAGAATFEPTSCAASVKVIIPVADICKMTNIAGFNEETVNLWVPAVGSNFDIPGSHGYDSPASYTINRDLATNPLDASCGEGTAVEIIPSAAQMNRDMPIINNQGKQIWPKP